MIYHTGTPLAIGLRLLLQRLESAIALTRPVDVYLAGGMAVHLYTAERVTTDVDAEFGARIFLPKDLMVEVRLEDGRLEELYLDTNYSPSFALMHEDYQESALPLDLGLKALRVYVLSPTDLAVSKISRFAPNDQEDIVSLVKCGLTTADAIEKRANEARACYVGGQVMLQFNIIDAVALARSAESSRVPPSENGPSP